MKRIGEYLWKSLVFVVGWLYIIFPLSFFTICANAYWLTRLLFSGKIKETRDKIRAVKKELLSITDLNREYAKFSYQFDGVTKTGIFAMWPTWIPCIAVMFYRGLSDNCDGAEHYCRWLFKTLKANSRIFDDLVVKKVIYVPYKLEAKSFKTVHYFCIVGSRYELKHNDYACYSNGKVTFETKDELAQRYLRGETKYIWLN